MRRGKAIVRNGKHLERKDLHRAAFPTRGMRATRLNLHYPLGCPTVEMAVRRVRQRVKRGATQSRKSDIRRRYQRSIDHLIADYLPIADRWSIWNNKTSPPILLAKSGTDDRFRVTEILRG